MQGHLEHTSTVRWPYAVADDFFTKQLPNNVTWLLTLMYSLDQTGAGFVLALVFWQDDWPLSALNHHLPRQHYGLQPPEVSSVNKSGCCRCSRCLG